MYLSTTLCLTYQYLLITKDFLKTNIINRCISESLTVKDVDEEGSPVSVVNEVDYLHNGEPSIINREGSSTQSEFPRQRGFQFGRGVPLNIGF